MSADQPFQDAAAQLDYPMAVVTAAAGGERSGCLVGFHSQCSIKPPRYLVCLSKANHTYPVAVAADRLAVHLLDASEVALAAHFGELTGDEVDKFAGLAVEAGPGGVPVLADCRAWFAGRVLDRIDLGDHTGFVLDPEGGRVSGPLGQLGFQRVRNLHPGHEA